MRKIITYQIQYSLLVLSFILCIQQMNAGLKASFDFATFSTPSSAAYIETYLTVLGKSVVYKKNNKGKFQGEVEVSMLFKQNDSIKAVKKYVLHSQEIEDTIKGAVNFIDVQRFALSNGVYDMELLVGDKNKSLAPYSINHKIIIDYGADNISVSDIEFLESYTKSGTPGMLNKSGFDLVPYVSDYYPDNLNRILFYCEGYNSAKVLGENEKIVLSYYIEAAETKTQMSDFGSFSIQKTGTVNVLLSTFNLNSLPTGKYNVVVEIKDKNNTVQAAKRKMFIRKNSKNLLSLNDLAAVDITNSFAQRITSRDTLVDHIRSLRPIASSAEKTFIDENVKTTKTELLQQFFFNFWTTRNTLAPESEWKRYYGEVKKVNANFGAINLKGYETDRGRVYLQYGPPDDRIVRNNETGSFPYEMWQYFKMKTQANRLFVFYNPDYVSSNYKLLHSDAVGELSNPDWQRLVQKDAANDYYINQDYLNSK